MGVSNESRRGVVLWAKSSLQFVIVFAFLKGIKNNNEGYVAKATNGTKSRIFAL